MDPRATSASTHVCAVAPNGLVAATHARDA